MSIRFHSTVIFASDFEKMKSFYLELLQQEMEYDFGNCIGFKNGLSLWELKEEYPLSQKLGKTFHPDGNKNLEICFETDDFDSVASDLGQHNLNYLHEVVQETWGQRTIRFYDPENNLVEVGESIPCFVKRFYSQGLTLEEVARLTSVPLEHVKEICQK
jgi:catechol 2,3-dioxygenase-like lactoylglutathione lyase family enzyme